MFRFIRILAGAALCTTVPAAAQTLKLSCEIVWTVSASIGGRQPIRSRYVDISDFTIDFATRAVANKYQLHDGDSGIAVRNALILDRDEVVMCQGEKCQEPIPAGANRVTLSLTRIDLKTGTLTRSRTEVSDSLINRQSYAKDMTARGECRPGA